MSVAERCGLHDPEGVQMRAARTAWVRWLPERTELRVVEELVDLRAWTRSVPSCAANDVLGVLASMTDTEPDAVTALVWAVLPGAEALARRLADLSDDIEGLLAGQLWIEVARAKQLRTRHVAATILARTRREVCAELGVGDLAMRRDRVWAETIRVENDSELAAAPDAHESLDDLFDQITDLMIEAMEANAIHVFDAWLIGDLAARAAALGVPGHRGRSGLTAPVVIDQLADVVHLSARAIRRRASAALDRLAEYVAVRDNPERFAMWRAQHTSCPVTPAEEMQLVLTEDCNAQFFRVRDLPPDAWAPDVSPERRRPATG